MKHKELATALFSANGRIVIVKVDINHFSSPPFKVIF
jgi:hypothetical protein